MKRQLFFLLSFFCCLSLSAQVTTKPAFIPIGYDGEITVIFNPNEGNGGMKNATQCWAHTGVTSNGKTWQHVPGSWRSYPQKCKLTKNTDGNWELKITPNVQSFYGCAASEKVTQLSFVFNDGPSGSLEGKTTAGGDIFVDFISGGLFAKITSPSGNQLLTGAKSMTIECAASMEADLTLKIDGEVVKSVKGTSLSYPYNFNKADTKVWFSATADSKTVTDELTVSVIQPTQRKSRPSGIDMGIYYNKDDATKVTLATYAASKTEAAQAVYVVGDFNNWTTSAASQMYQDGNYFWIELTDLEPQKEYAMQYVVVRADGVVKRISDLFSEKLLHPDDQYEPKHLDPSLRDYPEQGDGYVTVIQTQKPAFKWSDATLNFRRPDKNNLIIYELWVYDYTAERSLDGLMKRLDYLENLGVNAIELMPVCEFDGNYNWGYSPNHYFAFDKAYGTETQFKTFIDECHKRGMAVIMDMVFNHATGLNPMNKLYPYGDDLKYNPWFNVTAPHSDNVYEDWNHDFSPAKRMFTRALNYWLTEYHVDGYRMDLSHGFCGANCNKLMSNISHYYQNGVLAAADAEKHGEPYFIMEHWGGSMGTQRPQLVSEGMLCWENINNAYSQLAMGYNTESNLGNANRDGYVSYCESHDEERNYYKAKTYGSGIVKTDESARLKRVPLTMAFNLLLNGPHMIWQYNEIGYDYSINSTLGSSTISEGNRTSKKARPENLGWFQNALRMEQYQKVAQIVQLRTRLMPEVFAGNPTSASVSSGWVRTVAWGSGDNQVFVMGNFMPETVQTASLPVGTWYDYLAGGTTVQGGTISLLGGELRIFTTKKFDLPQVPASYQFALKVEDIVKAGGVEVWPTLTDDEINLSQAVDVEVYNLNGQMLLSRRKVSSLSIGSLRSGMYMLRLIHDGKQNTVKVIRR